MYAWRDVPLVLPSARPQRSASRPRPRVRPPHKERGFSHAARLTRTHTRSPPALARSLARLKSTAVAVGRSVVRMHAARCMGEGATETCFVRFEGTVLQWDTSVRDMIQTMLFILLSCPIDIMSGSLPPFLSDDEFYANEHVSRYLGGADDPRLTDAARCCFAKRISIAFSLPSYPRSPPPPVRPLEAENTMPTMAAQRLRGHL